MLFALLQALLSALVNKLGDPSRKLASDAAFLLSQLLLQHPAMKAVVVREVRPTYSPPVLLYSSPVRLYCGITLGIIV
jgi:hypothetical protein